MALVFDEDKSKHHFNDEVIVVKNVSETDLAEEEKIIERDRIQAQKDNLW